jgi:uncharacterized protein (TIGR03437 family)
VAGNVSGFVVPFAQAEGRNVILLSDHYYRGNGQAPNLTVDSITDLDFAVVQVAKSMLAVSQSADVPYRIAETNSFYGGGAPNISNSYGSALWVIDHLFDCASNGALGINLHGGGDIAFYTPIADSNGVVIEARPEFYGVTLFTLAGQGMLLKTAIDTAGLNATAYTIKSANGALNLVINNKDLRSLNATIHLPQAASAAQMIQLTGPSVSSLTGVTIQGSAIKPNGAFAPGPATQLPVSGSTVSCYVSPISAALIQIAAPATPPLTVAPGSAAPAAIASAYGSNLGSSVSVTDSAGVSHNARIYYASPSQINFEIPDAASLGAALVSIGTQTAFVQLAAVAPSLYTLNGAGLAAAYITRVTPGNGQRFESIFTTQNGGYLAAPINLNTPTDQVYLCLFGTGIRGAGSDVTVTVGGVKVQVTYAGPQGEIAGLDQINVLLPPSLAGSGTVKVVVTASQQTANSVNIEIE